MVRKRILVPLLAAAALLLVAAASSIHECAIPSGDDGCDSTAGGPWTGGCGCGWDPGFYFCLPVSRGEMRAVYFTLGVLIGSACSAVFLRFADDDDAEGEASGAAKKAGYVAIAAADLETGTGAGGKKN